MRSGRWQPMWRGILAVSFCAAARAAPFVQLRAAAHQDFSRIVFIMPPGMVAHTARLGDLLVLTFPGAGGVPGLQTPVARVLSVTGGDNQAAIGLPSGTRTHVWQIDARLIVDVFTAERAQSLPRGAQ